METLKDLKDYVPLFQTLLWVCFAFAAVAIFYRQIRSLMEVTFARVQQGSSFEAGPFKIGAELRDLPYVKPDTPTPGDKGERVEAGGPESPKAMLRRHREEVKQKNRYYYLVHVIEPSKQFGQAFDVFIYLTKPFEDAYSGKNDFSKVKKADFFLGKYWNNKVFTRKNDGGTIGLRTSAYGPFLCCCLVTFTDGTTVLLDRFIDFEMGKVFKPQQGGN